MLYGLVDCNNFFVSCERVFRPDLNGKPVVVLSNNDGCIVARSNEAKAMGIPMGLPYYKLPDIDKEGQVTAFSSNYVLYGDMSARVMRLLADSVGSILPYSIDESFYTTTDHGAIEQARAVRALIVKSTGIPVSVGLAPTKTLAKLASHFAKRYPLYYGVCAINTEEKRRKALALSPLKEIWGIGRRSIASLSSMGIGTALQYADTNKAVIRKYFGTNGVRTWQELNGIDCIELDDSDTKKSICTSRSFANMVETPDQLATHVATFASQCAIKLRKQHSVASIVSVFISSNRFRTDLQQYANTCTITLPVPAANTIDIARAAQRALAAIYRKGILYKKAGVIVSGISSDNAIQGALFDFDPKRREKHDALSKVIDQINRSEGSDTVHLAAQLPTEKRSDRNAEVFTNNLRREHLSPRYTTSLREIINVKLG